MSTYEDKYARDVLNASRRSRKVNRWLAFATQHEHWPVPPGHCSYCQQPFASLPTWDHVIPLVEGGPAWTWNKVPCCRPCNSAKGRWRPPRDVACVAGEGLRVDWDALRAVVLQRRADRPGCERSASPWSEKTREKFHALVRMRAGCLRTRDYLHRPKDGEAAK